jgi:chromosome segregation ATPase
MTRKENITIAAGAGALVGITILGYLGSRREIKALKKKNRNLSETVSTVCKDVSEMKDEWKPIKHQWEKTKKFLSSSLDELTSSSEKLNTLISQIDKAARIKAMIERKEGQKEAQDLEVAEEEEISSS